uniref:Uncharacterized protein n=1 Tax=Anguilla anguilla TaxID=7936 RepID=A0A0E9XMM9_ANGAN
MCALSHIIVVGRNASLLQNSLNSYQRPVHTINVHMNTNAIPSYRSQYGLPHPPRVTQFNIHLSEIML